MVGVIVRLHLALSRHRMTGSKAAQVGLGATLGLALAVATVAAGCRSTTAKKSDSGGTHPASAGVEPSPGDRSPSARPGSPGEELRAGDRPPSASVPDPGESPGTPPNCSAGSIAPFRP